MYAEGNKRTCLYMCEELDICQEEQQDTASQKLCLGTYCTEFFPKLYSTFGDIVMYNLI